MDKVRKPNISVCYTPSSEPYSIYLLSRLLKVRESSLTTAGPCVTAVPTGGMRTSRGDCFSAMFVTFSPVIAVRYSCLILDLILRTLSRWVVKECAFAVSHIFLACFPYSEKNKSGLWNHLVVCVYVSVSRCISPPLTGNDSVNTFLQKQIHKQPKKNGCTRCFLPGPCRIKYSMRSEKKVGV
jgi:hypothetical protein